MAERGERPKTVKRWLWGTLAVLVGAAIGVGVYTVAYADAPAYLGEDPATCKNCHVMNKQYDAWATGSHANVATCNDCHLPHDSIVDKYMVKAEDGVLHVSAFTSDNYPENIRARDKSREVINAQCLECHGTMTSDIRAAVPEGQELSCVRCHQHVGH